MTRRAELGQWFTAAPVAQLAIAALGGIPPGARVLDPTCGDGVFLAAARAAGARHVVGVEIDPRAAERARSELARDVERHPTGDRDRVDHVDRVDVDRVDRVDRVVEIVEADVLAPDLVERLGLFDIAIGNPPYVRAGRVDPAIKRERARVLAADWPDLTATLVDAIARHADVSATCLLRTLRFLRPGGRTALVVSTALLDADGAGALWTAIARIADIEALIAAPAERWFADAAVNPMLLVARRHGAPASTIASPSTASPSTASPRTASPSTASPSAASTRTTSPSTTRTTSPSTTRTTSPSTASMRTTSPSTARSHPRILRLTMATRDLASRARSLDDIALASEARAAHELVESRESLDVSAWGASLRAPSVWFAWRDRARDHLVPLRDLCDVRRGLTTGANDVFYVRRDEAKRLRLEPRFLAPVVRSPFNGAPAPIAIEPGESPIVAIVVPPDAKLARAPHIRAWLERHAATALATSAARRDPWWSLPVNPARLFFAKAYGPRFVQRLADTPMLADQRVYALHPKPGIELGALAAVLNALPTALALESLGRRSMGYGVVEWTVHDALELPVLDVRRASTRSIDEMTAAMRAIASRPVAHVRLEREDEARRVLDRAVLALAPGAELFDAMWDGLCASVAQRDRYLLPAV
ncbi:MAG: Eco57I restriction-modification methylase domain-containing protein [Kofleriaceae bacterium]